MKIIEIRVLRNCEYPSRYPCDGSELCGVSLIQLQSIQVVEAMSNDALSNADRCRVSTTALSMALL